MLKPVAKSMWGHGGVVQAPDGTIWKLATSAKKDTAPVSRKVDEMVLLIGADDVSASKKFYVAHGLTVGKSFGSYADFKMGSSPDRVRPVQARRAGQGRRGGRRRARARTGSR